MLSGQLNKVLATPKRVAVALINERSRENCKEDEKVGKVEKVGRNMKQEVYGLIETVD